MSQKDRRTIRSLAELGDAMRPPRPPAPAALMPLGDRPRCPCGKVPYPDRATAGRAASELGVAVRVYSCPLGHRVYHLMASGRSSRERGRGG